MNPSPSQLRWTGIFLASGIALVVTTLFFLLGARLNQHRLALVCEVRGESVSGLSTGGKVLLRGIEVGNITSLDFDKRDPERIFVGIEIDPGSPVYKDAAATLEIFGITGLKYLELSPGSVKAGLATAGTVLKIIPSRTAMILNMLDTVARTSARVMANLEKITSDSRQKQIDSIVQDLHQTSSDFAGMAKGLQGLHLDNRIAQVTDHVESAVRKIDSTITVIEPAKTLARIDTAASAFSSAAKRADLMLGRSQSDVYHSLEDLSTTLRNLSDFSQTIRDNPASLLRSGDRNSP